MTAADRTSRLLTLLPWLRAHPGVSVADAAAHFGVAEDVLVGDLALLTYVGPGQAGGDLVDIAYEPGGTITVIATQGLDAPMRLTPAEASALLAGLRLLAQLPLPGTGDAVATATAKLEAAAGAAAEAAAGLALDLDPVDAGVGEAVAAALDGRRRVALRYRGSGGEQSEREADPMRLLVIEGRTYLEAWCRRAEAVRLFRLDRIEALELLDAPADPPSDAVGFDPDAGLLPHGRAAVLLVDASAAWVVEAHPVTSVTPAEQGGLRVELPVADEAWLVRLVLSLGGAARVVAPADLAARVTAAARAALAAYDR